MPTHGVFLRLAGRRCVVLGGDETAAAKALACARAGGDVTVVAEVPTAELEAAAGARGLTWHRRGYRDGDLAGAFLAYVSERNPVTLARIRAEAERERVLLNVIDVPEACSFFAGAVVERGPLTILVGTDGRSPGAAADVRRRIEATVGREYGLFVEILGALRDVLRDRPERRRVLRSVRESPLLDLLRRGDDAAVNRLLESAAGADCTLARLGVRLDQTR